MRGGHRNTHYARRELAKAGNVTEAQIQEWLHLDDITTDEANELRQLAAASVC